MNTIQKYRQAYRNQKQCAIERGIDWQFSSFEEWFQWWGDDIIFRGPYKGQLVMARHNDFGPYHPNNVSKMKAEDNSRDANKGKKYPSTIKRQRKAIMTPDGRFESLNDAGKHYKLHPTSIMYRVEKYPTEYYYM